MRGFSLVEALIAISIIVAGIFGSAMVYDLVSKESTVAKLAFSFAVGRNEMLSLLSDNESWKNMIEDVTANGNPSLSCFRNQGSANPADRNCSAVPATALNIFDVKGDPRYLGLNPLSGFDRAGTPCVIATNPFSTPPGAPNHNCPIRLNITWQPICPVAATCVNPPVRLIGTFVYNGTAGQRPPALNWLGFNVVKRIPYCPAQPATGAVYVDDGGGGTPVMTTANQVSSNVAAAVATTDWGQYPNLILPCGDITIAYREDLEAITNANNSSTTCLTNNVDGICYFQVNRTIVAGVHRFNLLYNGASIYTMPVGTILNDASLFGLRVKTNTVSFMLNGRVVFTWPQKLIYPFRIKFRPASTAYSAAGFNGIIGNW